MKHKYFVSLQPSCTNYKPVFDLQGCKEAKKQNQQHKDAETLYIAQACQPLTIKKIWGRPEMFTEIT